VTPHTLRFFKPSSRISRTRNCLPHWQQTAAAYFLTFRLADSIPTGLRTEWQHERDAWMKHHPPPWTPEVEREYHERFSRRIESCLDAGHGACVLRQSACRQLLAESLHHFDGESHLLHAYVLMPNHAHVLTSLHPSSSLEKTVGGWKSVSSRRINRQLERRGTLWQEDYFDRLIRDEDHFANCVRYIRNNPRKAHLPPSQYTHFETELARSFVEEKAQ
jgi:REP element-mobilizing transposase RayT